MRESIHTLAQGRWQGVLSALGIRNEFLKSKNGPCPICGGKDRFKFDDKDGRGTFYCNYCGAGSGVDLVMKWRGVDFKGAVALIEPLVGSVQFVPPKARQDTAPQAREEMAALWKRAVALDGHCLASRYLQARGIQSLPAASAVRFVDELAYVDGGFTRLIPAMVAKFVAPDGASAILHRTWLQEPGEKADVQQPRKMWRGTIPEGGAVRLGAPDETMGVAEGLETALAAAAVARVPVWAATSDVGMIKFQPPAMCRHLIVFADNDASFAGQLAGYSLARRLTSVPADRRISVEVRLPGYSDVGQKEDFNDLLLAEMRAA